ncbi:MAG: hypothetical protein PHI72_00435 [Atribacterota bacterium]|nr:hypothetical protein [Atribacterota bacterium]MDD5636310.1 hypothetical protein [Atribacterota bacterium]
MIANQKKRLGEILLDYGLISQEELEMVLKEQKIRNKRVGEILIELHLVTQDQINWILSKQLDIPYVQIETNQLDLDLLKKFPAFLIKNYNIIPLIEMNDTLVVAMSDPTDEEALQKIKSSYKSNFEVTLASFKNISEIIQYIEKEYPDIW